METALYEFIARIRDAADNISMEATKLLEKAGKSVLKEYDPEKVSWQQVDGGKGPYERADKNDNFDNPDFTALLTDIKDHNGKMQLKAMFYWVFTDKDIIGRKPSKTFKRASQL